MDFRLRAFLAVANQLSFTRASKELGISQPAVTKHIHELENTYRVQLFSRQGLHISLTPEGEALKIYAEEIVAMYDRMNCEMALLRTPVFGELRVGTDTATAQRLYKETVPPFQEKFHNVELAVLVSSGKKMAEAVQNGELHLAILDNPNLPCGYEVIKGKMLPPQAEAFLEFANIYLKNSLSPLG